MDQDDQARDADAEGRASRNDRCSKPAEARPVHEELLAESARSYVSRTLLAVSAAAVGEQDLAIDLARQGCDEREPILIILTPGVFPDGRRFVDLIPGAA